MKSYTEKVKHCPAESCFDCEFFKADSSSLYVPTCRKSFDLVKTVATNESQPIAGENKPCKPQ